MIRFVRLFILPQKSPAYREMVKFFVIKFRRKTNLVFANVFAKCKAMEKWGKRDREIKRMRMRMEEKAPVKCAQINKRQLKAPRSQTMFHRFGMGFAFVFYDSISWRNFSFVLIRLNVAIAQLLLQCNRFCTLKDQTNKRASSSERIGLHAQLCLPNGCDAKWYLF